ncbi:hypothetical protein [Lactiplantibacillus daowaiensis]|uniref:Uncharacterized protein n=1 Tax=Lactiplantibacillus daowaiensis TaxID=2559918 RepID=A0ABW1RXW4_9LACO|nr:hypothetical protein [Lactiplantibacillus daowaiensis]
MKAAAINQALATQQLTVTYQRYRYSDAELIDPSGPMTLLSPAPRRLTQTINRLQVHDAQAQVCLTNVAEPMFGAQLMAWLQTPTRVTAVTLATTATIIQQAQRRGLTVTGVQVVPTACWTVTHEQTLLADLAAQLVPDVMQLGPYDNQQASMVIDDHRQIVLRRQANFEPQLSLPVVQFAIHNDQGQLLLTGLSLADLGAALVGLQLGLDPAALVTILLGHPLLPAATLTQAQLCYEQWQTSVPQTMQTVADLTNLMTGPVLPMTTTQLGQYRYWQPAMTRPVSAVIPAAVVLPVLTGVYYEPQVVVQATARAFSAALLKQAYQRSWTIQRRTRQLVGCGTADRLRFNRGQLQGFRRLPTPQTTATPLETVFKIQQPTSKAAMELSFNTLVTTLAMTK